MQTKDIVLTIGVILLHRFGREDFVLLRTLKELPYTWKILKQVNPLSFQVFVY